MLRRLIVLTPLFLFLCAPLLAQAGWKPISPRDGGFTVSLPTTGTPDYKEDLDGEAKMHVYSCDYQGKKFFASWLDYSDVGPGPDAVYKAFLDGVLEPGSKLAVDKATTLGSYSGHLYRVEDPGINHVLLMYLKGHRHVVLWVSGAGVTETDADVVQYFDTLKMD